MSGSVTCYESNMRKMYLVNFFNNLTLVSAVLIPFFTQWGKLSFQQILFLQSFFQLCVFLLEVPTGVIADKFGRKTSIALGLLIKTIATTCYSIIPNFYLFMLAEFLFALGVTLISGADQALIYDSLKKVKKESNATKVFSNYTVAGTIAVLIT